MRRLLWFALLWFSGHHLVAQSFEMSAVQDVYKGYIGETLKVPLKITNHTDAPLVLVVKRLQSNLGSSQKDYFCPAGNCLRTSEDGFTLKLEPGESLEDFEIALDAGLAGGISSARYAVYNRYNATEIVHFDLNFSVEERSSMEDIFTHPEIVLHELYPNPVIDHAYVKYDLFSHDLDVKIVIHNILGNVVEEYELPPTEKLVKIRTDALTTGVYFYTLYLDNEGVVTRKLIVKK